MGLNASPPVPLSANAEDGDERLWSALGRVTDPEYPLSIVDLGMVYGATVDDGVARIRLTFTSIGCPAADMLVDDIKAAVARVPAVRDVVVEVVWSPPWSSERISPQGKRVLAMYGVAT